MKLLKKGTKVTDAIQLAKTDIEYIDLNIH